MLRLHDHLDSGNGYKVRFLLRILGIPYEFVPVDVFNGESRTPAFLAKNPNGRIPVLEMEDGRYLAESNAILFHLAEGTPYLPSDPWERAQALQWLFFEQYSHEPNIATVRSWLRHTVITVEKEQAIVEKRKQGYAALSVMENHLATRTFFVGERFTIADIALYAYTHVAHEGGFDLSAYPKTRAWLERCRAQPGCRPITEAGP